MGVHQFLAQFLEQFRIFGREALVQMNVFSFNVPKIVKRFYKHSQINVLLFGTTGVPKDANYRNSV